MDDSTDPHWGELLERARRDNQNRGTLLSAYRNYLTMLAQLHIDEQLQQKLDASDVVQETYLEAHRSFAAFRGSSEPELLAWLRSILASKVSATWKRYYAAQQRDIRLERRLEEAIEQSSHAAHNLAVARSSPSEQAEQRELSVLLANALESLPRHYRQVILLRDLRQLSFPEIGDRMGRSAAAVRKLWVRAMAELSHILAGKSNDLL